MTVCTHILSKTIIRNEVKISVYISGTYVVRCPSSGAVHQSHMQDHTIHLVLYQQCIQNCTWLLPTVI